MTESFVDLSYRGLPLGRRVKLTQVRPATGYLEMPAPMPVGTSIVITSDEGVVIEARVTGVHEQVAGSDRAPGMLVAPVIADDVAKSWWDTRVTLPVEDPPAPARPKPVTVRPRSQSSTPVGTTTAPHAVPPPPVAVPRPDAPLADAAATIEKAAQAAADNEATIAQPAIVDDGGKTTVMDAIDPALLAELTGTTSGEMAAVRATGEHAIVDDGKQTMMMDAIDPAALGLESGPTETPDDDPRASSPSIGGSVKKRKKKR